MSMVIFFDQNNFVSLARIRANGDGMTMSIPAGTSVSRCYRVAETTFDLTANPIPLWEIDPYENFVKTRTPFSSTPPLQNIQVQLSQGEFRDILKLRELAALAGAQAQADAEALIDQATIDINGDHIGAIFGGNKSQPKFSTCRNRSRSLEIQVS